MTTLILRCVFVSVAVCLAACSSVPPSPPAQAPKVASRQPETVATPKELSPKESPPQPVAHEEKPAASAATPRRAEATPTPKAPVAKPASASPPAKAPKPPAAEVAAAKPPPAAQPAAPKPAPLDLKTLEQRLKDTSAIGVLTKLSLKNQVDDLVDRFRAYHDGKRPPTLAELRPNFELLLMKVLSLLQDKDAALAHDIDASRDAIWSVLADKQKFAEFA